MAIKAELNQEQLSLSIFKHKETSLLVPLAMLQEGTSSFSLPPIKEYKAFTICPDTVVTFLLPFGLPRGFFAGNGPTVSPWDKRRKII